ncbi:MAG: flippase-like domain-containing protein [Ruminococcus sp.]|nr:flippase-like domain-containing protein [Ruminococcus sp.]
MGKFIGQKNGKISVTLVLNIVVAIMTAYLLVYFCVSEDGMIDLLSKHDGLNLFWLLIALLVYEANILIDSVVTFFIVRTQFKSFRFLDAIKVAFVGIFFSAVTPSSTGGQPMQLYLLSKMRISVGFGSACMTQKFIVYQIMTALFSIYSVITRFDLFKSAFTNFWSSAFIVLGLLFQLSVTAGFLIISFNKRLTNSIMKFVSYIMHKLKFIKNPDGKIKKIQSEVDTFHSYNKVLIGNKKLLIFTYLMVFFQVLCVMAVPFFIYISFGMPQIANANGVATGNFADFVCIQSFVIFTSNLVPLPGASGGAELAFTMYFSQFFEIGNVSKIKPAILMWRFISYYATLLISSPFSFLTRGKRIEDGQKLLENNIANQQETENNLNESISE